jgi:hypothetical protein
MHTIMNKKFYLGPNFGTLFNKSWVTISELLHYAKYHGPLTAGKDMYARPCSTKYCFYHARTYMLYPNYNQMKEMSSLVGKLTAFCRCKENWVLHSM